LRESGFVALRRPRLPRGEKLDSISTLQLLTGIFLLFSAAFGIYLLATDNSLWILAVSHAFGLVAIVGIDVLFGILCIFIISGCSIGVSQERSSAFFCK
jgi:hypothetical protein